MMGSIALHPPGADQPAQEASHHAHDQQEDGLRDADQGLACGHPAGQRCPEHYAGCDDQQDQGNGLRPIPGCVPGDVLHRVAQDERLQPMFAGRTDDDDLSIEFLGCGKDLSPRYAHPPHQLGLYTCGVDRLQGRKLGTQRRESQGILWQIPLHHWRQSPATRFQRASS